MGALLDAGSHDPGCRRAGHHTDAARHASDAVNLHVQALGWASVKKWVAIRLSDGRGDGVLYDDRRSAIRHQLHQWQCAYICVPPGGVNPCQAESYLRTVRAAYDAGAHLVDPDDPAGGPEIIKRLTRRDQAAQVSAILATAR